jgi:hypothetical protein
VGTDEVSDPQSLKVAAGTNVTLQVTVPNTKVVAGLKVVTVNSIEVSPQKGSEADSYTHTWEYTFKMPSAPATIQGTLVDNNPEELIKIPGAFDNTLYSLDIAQGELAVSESTANKVRTFLSGLRLFDMEEGEDVGNDTETAFDSDTTSYTASVPFSGYPAVVAAIPTESEADVKITQTEVSGNGTFTVTIEVTAPFWVMYEDSDIPADPPEYVNTTEKTKTYTIAVTRGAGDTNTNLSSVTVAGAKLTQSGDTYSGNVPYNTDKLHISAAAKHMNARVQLIHDGTTKPESLGEASNNASMQIAAPAAERTADITIKVTSEGGTEKQYTIQITKDTQGKDAVYNATGGISKIVTIGDNTKYEIHEFLVDEGTALGNSSEYTLSFVDGKKPQGAVVEVLVVGGGGGGGKSEGANGWRAGGGGAGGFIYHPKYQLPEGNEFTVKVGAGGAKATKIGVWNNQTSGTEGGGNGGDSAFGDGFLAKGGGGGGSHGGNKANKGKNGGSGGGAGGAGKDQDRSSSMSGIAPEDAVSLGNSGGIGKGSYSGGGGGGAGGPGASTNADFQGANGGVGTQSAISGDLSWYAAGGAGGAEDQYNNDPEKKLGYGAGQGNNGDPNTGNGGSGGGGVAKEEKYEGGDGGSGIVIIRWRYVEQ